MNIIYDVINENNSTQERIILYKYVCYDNLNCNWKLVIENINIGQISYADDSAIATNIKTKKILLVHLIFTTI